MNFTAVRCEQLLALYRARRDACQQELAQAIAAQSDRLEDCRRAQQRLDAAGVEQRQALAGATIDALCDWHRYRQSLCACLEDARLALLAASERVEAQRQLVLAAERRLTALERLDERQRAARQLELARRQGRQLDEIAALRFSRAA